MKTLSQTKKVVNILQRSPKEKFTARQLAEALLSEYPDDYAQKRANPRFPDDKAFIQQLVAEMGSQKDAIRKAEPKIRMRNKPRPRVFWFDPDYDPKIDESDNDDNGGAESSLEEKSGELTEYELYPKLVEFLKSELKLYCLRIDEKRSKNRHGPGGNHWLHPDIVAMEPIDQQWHDLVRSCVRDGDGQRVRLWSFEVKKQLSRSNVRMCYFQAVSNSSWASEGYLVTAGLADEKVEGELKMLSALHGIGVILLNSENPSESDVLFPATSRPEVDWQSVNRLAEENSDFRDFVEQVSAYYQTGRIRAKDWD